MKRLIIALLCLIALCVLSPVTAADAENGYLAQISPEKMPLARAMGVALEPACEDVYLVQTARDLAILRSAGLVVYSEPNRILHTEVNSWNIDAVHAASAWDHQDAAGNYDRRGEGVTIAIVDSGVDPGHGDLNADRILPCKNYGSSETGVDTWHGTFVAGIIAAQLNNGTGIDGMTPEVTILPVTVTSNGVSDAFTAIRGIDYAANHGADVINLSIGGDNDSSFLERTCRNAAKSGVILVASAGNYKDGETSSPANVVYPAGYDCVVSVSGCRQTADGPVFDEAYSYYNDRVDVCAPGTKIRSLYLNSGTAVASGTSFAAPMVSAMAAVAKQTNPAIDTDLFLELLEATSTDLGEAGRDVYYGMGFVNMEAFIELLDTVYPIHYLSDGAPARFSTEVQTAYTIADPEITLPEPVRHGYRFLGWYENADLSGAQVRTIPTASMGERSFHAKWELLPNDPPVVTEDAPAEAAAAPKSLDGVTTPMQAFTADVSTWFSDPNEDPLTFRLTDGPGILAGSELVFEPAAADADTDVPITIRANDGFGHTVDHTVTVHVGPVPPSQPALSDAGPLELAETPAELSMGLILYDSTVTGVSLGDTPAQWHMEGEILSADLPELDEGEYALTIEFDRGEPVTRSIFVRSADYLFVRPGAPKEGRATPASLDGVTSATPYYEDVSSWFTEPQDLPLTYEITDGPGTLDRAALEYIPAADDANTDVPITVRADDGLGHTAAHTVTVHVGPRHASQPLLDPPDDMVALDLCSVPAVIPVDLVLYDSQITAVLLGETELTWNLDGQTLYVDVPALEPGNYTVSIEFDAGLPVEWPWHVFYSVPAPAVDPDAPADAEAAPASLDGATEAVPFLADVSAWFEGEDLTYSIVSGPGDLAGSVLTFLPETGGGEVSITVRASDLYGRSADHTVTVRVGPIPAGQPVLESEDLVLYLCDYPKQAECTLALNGAELLSVTLNETMELTWQMADKTLSVDIPPLPAGDYPLSLEFEQNKRLTWTWHVRECPSAAFKDVQSGAWYHSYVDWAVENGLMNGMAPDRFDPQGGFTRAMLVTVLYRAEGCPEAPETCPFADVAPGRYYSEAVAWAAGAGIVNGMDETHFAPESPITREQLVTILFRYAGDDGTRADLSVFPDAAAVHSYAKDAVAWAVGRGIVNGVGNGGVSTLSPRSGASRAQVAAMIMRYLTAEAPSEVAP